MERLDLQQHHHLRLRTLLMRRLPGLLLPGLLLPGLLLSGCEPGPGKPGSDDSAAPDTTVLPPLPLTDLPPGVSFLDPREGDVFTAAQSVHVDILAGDDNSTADGRPDLTLLALAWSGNLPGGTALPTAPGPDGTVDFEISPLPLGEYTLTVEARDPADQPASATVHFSVVTPDADGDGYVNDRLRGDDCDDADPAIHPGAVEVCDNTDNDCDGDTDEGVTTRYWSDLDGDSYGDPLSPVDACTQPATAADNDRDCDDAQPAAFPRNPEVCDHLDNDCDGETDEAVLIPYYRDLDADTYGDPADIVYDCAVPAGYSALDTDCDDLDALVSPAAAEICLDGQDNDCDGTSNQCGLGGLIQLSTAADATLTGEAGSDYAGSSVSGGDFDDDGLADLLVGAFGNDGGGADAGAVYLLHGPVSGAQSLGNAALTLQGEAAGDNAGYALSSAGDYNGDGRDDILVGAYSNDTYGADAGAAYLVHGGDSGVRSLGLADGIFWGSTAGDQAGSAVSSAGDTDGDGFGDLLIGGWGADTGGSLSGSAWLIRGPFVGNTGLDLADARRYAPAAGEFAGYAVSGAGDVNGDGFDDVLIGAYGADGAAGRTYLVHGPLSGSASLASATAILYGENSGDNAGAAVSSAGDTDGDGLSDILIGAYNHDYGGSNTGAAYVVLGPVGGGLDLSAADSKLVGEDSDDNAGWSVASAGDMDGDGQDDLLIGAFREDTGGGSAGAAYLAYGPPAALVTLRTADAKLYGAANDYAGYSIAAVGDTDGDGKADVLVGGIYADTGGSYLCGSAWLVRGTGL